MTRVVIQPSFGNPDAWRHWADTLDKEVPFADSSYASALAGSDLSALVEMHPAGRARFWGATGNHDDRMAALQTGDIVLFTGKKLVRAIGEVGYSFRSPGFADRLWDPHAERGSYRNVYSLRSFQPTVIPYEEVWALPGFNAGDNFMGLRFVDSEKSTTLIEGLGIRTATSIEAEIALDERVARSIAAAALIPVEAVNVEHTSYERSGGTTLVHRAEALLVRAYRATLGEELEVARVRTPSGITDLYVKGAGHVEIVEAKRSADHGHVRDAVGQLLDYVVHSPEPVTRLAALLPERPTSEDVALLHRYGIDCVHLNEDGEFDRVAASESQRAAMLNIWSGG
jgi:hypothetical protein